MKHNSPQNNYKPYNTIIVVEGTNQVITPIHIQFRFVLQAAGFIAVPPHFYTRVILMGLVYSYGNKSIKLP
jgi:hypothetical protein